MLLILKAVELLTMRDHSARINLSRSKQVQQRRDRMRRYQRHADRRTSRPQSLDVKFDALAMHADVRNVSAFRNKVLTHVEGGRDANSFHDDVKAIGFVNVLGHEIASGTLQIADVIDVCGAHLLRDGETIVVHIEEDELAWRVELRRQARCKTHGSCADDCDGASGRYFSAEDPDLQTCREYVAEDKQGAFIDALGHMIEGRVGVFDANVLGLSAIVRMAKDPARFDTAIGHTERK
jgi:hypothetical protein